MSESADLNPAFAEPCIVQRELPRPVALEQLHAHPVAARVLAHRGVISPDEVDYHLGGLPTPDALPDIDLAVARLLQARESGQRIMVVGDYDCDGATSTAVAVLGLALLGFDRQRIDNLVPNRFANGYGLSPAIVDRVIDTMPVTEHDGPPLILTVDNGVAAVEAVSHAATLGIDVVVTDHHLPPPVLPRARAIVNPVLETSTFATRALAGVSVMFYLLLAMRAALRERGETAGSAALVELLDLVAIGTVADLVPLDRTNRILVEQGLRRIRAGRSRPGVYALLKTAGRDPARTSTDDIGFAIGPRLNAAGRIDDMRHGIACLLAEDEASAAQHAEVLDGHNRRRRTLEARMRDEADLRLTVSDVDDQVAAAEAGATRFALAVHDAGWHEGVIGILASRLKERWHRPVVVLTTSEDGSLKGSARSIPGVHMRDVIAAIDVRNPELLTTFGGHAMAAGMTLVAHGLDAFERELEAEVRRVLDGVLPTREWLSDGQLTASDITLDLARVLADLAPWGQGFEAPQFDGEFVVISHREVGTGHLKLVLQPVDGTDGMDAIAFNHEDCYRDGQKVRAIYALDVNRWRDRESLQLQVKHLIAL